MSLKDYLYVYDVLQDLLKNSPKLGEEVPEILDLFEIIGERCISLMNREENEDEY